MPKYVLYFLQVSINLFWEKAFYELVTTILKTIVMIAEPSSQNCIVWSTVAHFILPVVEITRYLALTRLVPWVLTALKFKASVANKSVELTVNSCQYLVSWAHKEYRPVPLVNIAPCPGAVPGGSARRNRSAGQPTPPVLIHFVVNAVHVTQHISLWANLFESKMKIVVKILTPAQTLKPVKILSPSSVKVYR